MVNVVVVDDSVEEDVVLVSVVDDSVVLVAVVRLSLYPSQS